MSAAARIEGEVITRVTYISIPLMMGYVRGDFRIRVAIVRETVLSLAIAMRVWEIVVQICSLDKT